jgi:hypothetical protein
MRQSSGRTSSRGGSVIDRGVYADGSVALGAGVDVGAICFVGISSTASVTLVATTSLGRMVPVRMTMR